MYFYFRQFFWQVYFNAVHLFTNFQQQRHPTLSRMLLIYIKGGCENAFRGSRRALHPAAYTITISYYHIQV